MSTPACRWYPPAYRGAPKPSPYARGCPTGQYSSVPAHPDGIATDACGEPLNENCEFTHAWRSADSFFASFSASAFLDAIS